MNSNEREIYNYLQSHPNTPANIVAEALPNIPSVEALISKMRSKGVLLAELVAYPLPQGGDGHRNIYTVNPNYHAQPSAAATPSATDSDPLAAVMNEQPQTPQNAPQSPSDTTDGQFTAEDGQALYSEILSGRRYGQIGFRSLRNLIADVDEGETEPQIFVEVMRHYCQVMLGDELPDKQDIPNKEVRQYVRTIIGDPDVKNPDQYVLHILKNRRHYKYNKQDISNCRWTKELQARAEQQ